MERVLRWAVAVLVTLAAVSVPTWLCGAIVLPPLLADGAIRWGLAGVVGVALAALAALWGYGFASSKQEPDPPAPPAVQILASGARSVAISGNPTGGISTGGIRQPRAPQAPVGPTPGHPPNPPAPAPPPGLAPGAGSVTAAGERAIAIGGNPIGNISTGDELAEEPQ